MTPEQKARVSIDALLVQAGWHVCSVANANIHAASVVEAHFSNGLNPEPNGFNPAIPIESFDIVVTDEAHSINCDLWRQVREYFDAYRIKAEVCEQCAVCRAQVGALLPSRNTNISNTARRCPA